MGPHRQFQSNKPLVLITTAIAAAGLAALGTYVYTYSKRVRRCKSVLQPVSHACITKFVFVGVHGFNRPRIVLLGEEASVSSNRKEIIPLFRCKSGCFHQVVDPLSQGQH